jgi:hypothetical protein
VGPARGLIPITADHDRAVADHTIDLWEGRGQLLASMEVLRGQTIYRSSTSRSDPIGRASGWDSKLLLHAEELTLASGSMKSELTQRPRLLRTCRSTRGADAKNSLSVTKS